MAVLLIITLKKPLASRFAYYAFQGKQMVAKNSTFWTLLVQRIKTCGMPQFDEFLQLRLYREKLREKENNCKMEVPSDW